MFNPVLNPGADYSGMYQWAMEHTGDLVHRAAYADDLRAYGIGAIFEKLGKLQRWRSGMDQDPRDQATRNHAFLSSQGGAVPPPLNVFLATLDAAGHRYGVAYERLAKLPSPAPCTHPLVQTALQRHAVAACVALGDQSWARYDALLGEISTALHNVIDDNDALLHLYHAVSWSSS